MSSFIKKFAKLVLASLVILLIVQAPFADAASLSELKNRKSVVEQKKNQLKKEINEKTNKINEIKSNQQQLKEQIQQINEKAIETNNEINSVNVQILKKDQEIENIQAEINKLQEKINQRDELLKERARALQANGEISYLDVLLGAKNFVDLIDRFSAVNTLIEADRQILRDQKNDKLKLEEHELKLRNAKKSLENKKKKLNQLVTSLNEQEKQKNQLISELEKESKNIATEKALLQEQYEDILELSEELNNMIIEQQKKYIQSVQSDEYKVAPGDWTNPATGYLTSGFGGREHPIEGVYKIHYGIDIARSGPNVPIYAAATGQVTYAGPLSTYGNVVMITHNMGGQIYTSLYAHLRSYSVRVGQKVTKGQRIATMGNTGNSTGQHLHFEIHVGTWKGQKVGAQNPLNFIPGGFLK